MDTGFKAVVPLLGGVVAEVLLGLVPRRHSLALDDRFGFFVVGGAVFGVGDVEAEGDGFVAPYSAKWLIYIFLMVISIPYIPLPIS